MQKRVHKGEVGRIVGQSNEEGERGNEYVGSRHAAGDKKNKNKEQRAGRGKKGLGLMRAQRQHSRCPDRGSVPGRSWLSRDLILVLQNNRVELKSVCVCMCV
jgi:hypothetical protein